MKTAIHIVPLPSLTLLLILQTKVGRADEAFPRGAKHDERRRVNEKANEIFSKLADCDHIHYLDIGPKFMNKDGELTRGMMPDLLHLTEQGYEIWAESIESSLSRLLGE